MSKPERNQCRFCDSRKCRVRICTRCLTFDEIACSAHAKDLERLADLTLAEGTKRLHWQGLGSEVSRGENMDDVFDDMEAMHDV